MLKFLSRYIVITLAALLYAVGIAFFLNPNQLAPGGVSGIAIVLKSAFPFLPGLGMLILIMNLQVSKAVLLQVIFLNVKAVKHNLRQCIECVIW